MTPCKWLPREACDEPTVCVPTVCARLEKPLIDAVLPERAAQGVPARWSVWQHKNGDEYVVLMTTNVSDRQDEYPATVVYWRPRDRTRWSRNLSRWHGSFTLVRAWATEDIIAFLLEEEIPK